ncbi:MAG: MutS-related protein [Acetivibrionales bacterium]|jgi:hypothetical protein
MLEYLIIFIAVLAFLISTNFIQSIKHKKKVRDRIRNSWAALPENDFDEYDFKSFSKFFNSREKKSTEMIIDDITWNDLEMDSFYNLINNTMTSLGDSMLYCILRTPLFDRHKFADRIQTIDYWTEHKDDREKTQAVLAGTGKFRPSRIDSLIDKCGFLKLDNQWVFKLLSFFPLLSLPLLFINPGYGVLWAVFGFGINALYYTAKVKELFLGLEVVTQAIKIINLAKKLYKNKPNGLNKKYAELNNSFMKLRPLLRKGSFSSALVGFTGNIIVDMMAIFYMVFLIDLWRYQSSIMFIETHYEDFVHLIEIIGEIDATIGIASYRECVKDKKNSGLCCKPEIMWDPSDNNFTIVAEDVVHPLIKDCMPNSVMSVKPILVTGSNASGKSTYLKTIAINTLMAHSLGFCLAKNWISIPLFPITSMALRDSIINEESYFIAEIKSLKRMFSRVDNKITCLCVIDEVLRGTNTIERIAASSQVLFALAQKNTCIFAATHDIELTYILSDLFENKHFEEEISYNDIRFDYRIKDGRATSRNAIKLLKIMGFGEDVIKNANEAVEAFERQNKWTKIEGVN